MTANLPSAGGWHRVAARSELPSGEALGARIEDLDVALIELDGTIYALSNICPHAYALMSDGFLEGDEIECPLHAARFDIRTGKCTEGPATEDLAVYEVYEDNGDIFVKLPSA